MCVEEVARASSNHFSFHFDGFMVHRDVPPVTSTQQFIDDLATHLRMTTGFTIPYDLKEHFSFTQQDDLGEGSDAALGITTGLWLAAAHAGRVVLGAVDDLPVRDWLTAVNDGIPAIVMRPAIGFDIPEDVGSSLIVIHMQDLGVVCPCYVCCFKLLRFTGTLLHFTGKAAHRGRCRTGRRRSPCPWTDAVGASQWVPFVQY